MVNANFGESTVDSTRGSASTSSSGRTGHAAPRIATRRGRGLNVNGAERVLSVVGGTALTVYGARRKDWLGCVFALVGAALVQRGATGHCSVYEVMGVDTAEGDHGLVRQHGVAATVDAKKAVKVERSTTIDVPAAELYRFWRNFENLPRIMSHLESVTVTSSTRSRWKAKAPAGTTVEWDAEINNEIANQLIAWKSVHEASVPNAGSVHFTPATGGRGTVVRVVLDYEPPAGRLGMMVAKLFGEEPGMQVREDLRRFKAMMETGETPTIEGQSSGRETA